MKAWIKGKMAEWPQWYPRLINQCFSSKCIYTRDYARPLLPLGGPHEYVGYIYVIQYVIFTHIQPIFRILYLAKYDMQLKK